MGDSAEDKRRTKELLDEAVLVLAERTERLARRVRPLPGVELDTGRRKVRPWGIHRSAEDRWCTSFLFLGSEQSTLDRDGVWRYADYTLGYGWEVKREGGHGSYGSSFDPDPWVDIELTINADGLPQLRLSCDENRTGVCYPGTLAGWDELITDIQARYRHAGREQPYLVGYRFRPLRLYWRERVWRVYRWWLCRPGL